MQYDLKQEINDDKIVSLKCGTESIIALSSKGCVYLKKGDECFRKIEELQRVKEIQASNDYYAVLTQDNQIFTMVESSEQRFLQVESSLSSFITLKNLILGADFGHVMDQELNLYGWGNNKNGELGTSDSFPRQKLS